VRGWINYYGRFYKSMLYPLIQRINEHLMRWACWKYKRLHRRPRRARKLLARIVRGVPSPVRALAHRDQACGLDNGSRISREVTSGSTGGRGAIP
jgi:hypothetical protein